MQRILIKHLSGSRANRTDAFPSDGATELLLGRDVDAHVRYDLETDDLVSRRHASIAGSADTGFVLRDLGSRNGTWVNGERADVPVALKAGDVVQLGNDGPRFLFDLDPRPQGISPIHEEQSPPSASLRTTIERLLRQRRLAWSIAIGVIAALVLILLLLILYLALTRLETVETSMQPPGPYASIFRSGHVGSGDPIGRAPAAA